MQPETIERRALERDFLPESLADAHFLIELLRERILEMLAAPPDGMATLALGPREARIYSFLKSRAKPVTFGAIYAAGWGIAADEVPNMNLLRQHINNIRRKLPSTERIRNLWGSGYVWERTDAG